MLDIMAASHKLITPNQCPRLMRFLHRENTNSLNRISHGLITQAAHTADVQILAGVQSILEQYRAV